MAIVQGTGFGGMKKSVGGLTFRQVGDRIIVSKKIVKNKSNTPRQAIKRTAFGILSSIGGQLRPLVEIGFDPWGNGTRHNSFVQANNDLRNYLNSLKLKEKEYVPMYYLYQALNDPKFIGHITASRGSMNTESILRLNDKCYPEGMITLSRNYRTGDKVHLCICTVYQGKDDYFTSVGMCEATVNIKDPAHLAASDTFIVNKQTMDKLYPLRGERGHLKLEGAIIAGMVTRGTKRSTTYFSLLKDC